jgi:tetratricopeptide (TPR) repeat protein
MEGLVVLPGNPALLGLRKRTEKEMYYFCTKLLLSGRKEAALLNAGNILKINPKSVLPWMIKSSCMQAMGKTREGLEAAAMAVRLEPDNADTHFLLGSIMFDAGQLENAIAQYREALQLSEKHRKYAIYSRAGMLDALSKAGAASGNQLESMVSGRLKETTEYISQSKVLSEAAGSLVE